MIENLMRRIASEIADNMVNREYSFAPNRRAVHALLRTGPVWDGIGALLPFKERVTCETVLTACLPAMDTLSETPPSGWLAYCHKYVQHLMYSDAPCFQPEEEYIKGAQFYLAVLQTLLDNERADMPFDPLMEFKFLDDDMALTFDSGEMYLRFYAAYREEYVYELMRLGQEITPFHTLGHIAGVHHVATTVAQGLVDAGNTVDIPLVSAAAASHDFGKYGCRPGERVPYLHYYYTDHWLSARQMGRISHIASNHSAWDLELDSLSVESLCLIYADFRSKQEYDAEGREIIVLFSLDDAFAVILGKLDDVDDEKRRRYRLVYRRLHDFEEFMKYQGVDVGLTGQTMQKQPDKNPALMTADEAVQSLSILSVGHNLSLMYHLTNERKFGNLIESARSAKNWQQLRAYLDIFGEYCTYLNADQKSQAVAFLYDLLIHRDGDVRRQAAGLIGQIIAKFHLVYRKEIPADVENDPAEAVPFALWEEYLNKMIYPDHKMTDQQRSHIGYTLKLVMDGILDYSRPEDTNRFVGVLLDFCVPDEEMIEGTAFTLMDAISYLPVKYYGHGRLKSLVTFAAPYTKSEVLRLQTVALQFLESVTHEITPDAPLMEEIVRLVRGMPPVGLTLMFQQYKIMKQAGVDVSTYEDKLYHQDITGELFLDNLKIATHWIVKVVGVELLRDQVAHGEMEHILHISTHLSNLVKVSERVVVRHRAGKALMSILPRLRREQRNEVVVELGKGLEVGQYEISKYIPQYLGEAILYLHPSELSEQVHWLQSLLASTNDSVVMGALNTIAIILEHYPVYKERFQEEGNQSAERQEQLLGLLLKGLAHYRENIRQEALLVIGRILFGSKLSTMEEKAALFSASCRKLLFLIREGKEEDKLSLYFRAAALSHVSRFVILWQLEHDTFPMHSYSKIAFFPGTFDPFTLSHKGIVHAIRELGFEVYLAVDEFSWSKKSQPHLIRRQIVNLSMAGDFHVHLFPSDIPINIANPVDLKSLTALFPDQDVYLVVGSDVVKGASSYQNLPTLGSVHGMNHVIFHRVGQEPVDISCITGKTYELQLPPHLEDVSSTRIRENVELNRDISSLIDPVIQELIYQNGLYLRDSQYKPVLNAGDLYFQWIPKPARALVDDLTNENKQMSDAIMESGDQLLLLRHSARDRAIGYISYRILSTAELFSALKDPHLAGRIRLRAAGKTLLITGMVVGGSELRRNMPQVILSELLAQALKEECAYGIFREHLSMGTTQWEPLLARQGFLQIETDDIILEVNMRTPLVFLQNLETTIQEPLCYNPQVLTAIQTGHESLQSALTMLFPGSLVLTLMADIIHHRLLERITAINEVPNKSVFPRKLGKLMCVPFGKILRGKIVPNTVTKTIHTDRVFSSDLQSNSIETFPNYPPIAGQIRTIKSFNRGVILVDDLLHEGYRIQALNPILHRENVDIRTVLVGVMSGYGQDLMEACNRPAESIYFLPSIRHWFVEATLYPFIGGNTVERNVSPVPGMLPGINHILPYSQPMLRMISPEATVKLSRCCLESTLNVIQTLEQEYRSLYSRNLTLNRLAEAVILPLCPDKGPCLKYDANLAASVYIKNDLEQLLRSHQ